MSQKSLPQRSEVPVEETWNLESIFATPKIWKENYENIIAQLPELEKFQGKLSENAQKLLQGLKLFDEIFIPGMQVYVYAGLAASVDVGDQDAAARFGQARGLLAKVRTATAFVEPEIMAIGFDVLEKWIEEESELVIYEHYFDQLKKRGAHVRSPEVEEVIAMVGDPLPPKMVLAAYSSLTNADLNFKPAISSEGEENEVGQSSINSLITHTDREIRRTAWENYADSYLEFKNTLASIQTQVIQRDVFNMRARNYESSLQASLKPNDIPQEVFHNLIDVFK